MELMVGLGLIERMPGVPIHARLAHGIVALAPPKSSLSPMATDACTSSLAKRDLDPPGTPTMFLLKTAVARLVKSVALGRRACNTLRIRRNCSWNLGHRLCMAEPP